MYCQVIADFDSDTTAGCCPVIIHFADNSSGNITSWQWEFGNGNSSTFQNPDASYVTPGVYTVSLTVSDGTNSDTKTITGYITAYKNPEADFSSINTPSGCVPLTVSFNDLSTIGDAPIDTWIWDFGDGATSNLQSPSHLFAISGTYPVSLQVVDQNNCENTILKPNFVQVSERPVPFFISTNAGSCVVPHTVDFINSSTGSGNLNYYWIFGDGSTSTDETPSHTYNSMGMYNVTLIVTDNNGCSDTLIRNNYVQITEVEADFFITVADTICPGDLVHFNNISTGGTYYVWDFGEGTPQVGYHADHIFYTPGNYEITLNASSNGGICQDSMSINIVVEEVIADFIAVPTYGCEIPFDVQFTDQSTNAVSWTWYFGDGTQSSLQNPLHTYQMTTVLNNNHQETYNNILIVESAHGCTDTKYLTDNIEIILPQAGFYANYYDGCAPLSVNFTNTCTYNSTVDNIVSWQWDFGDGNTSALQNPSNTFVNDGDYIVNLTITTSLGCTHSFYTTILVGSLQHPDFSFNQDTVCASDSVVTFNQSSDTTLIDFYLWDFGNSGSGSIIVPDGIYNYTDTGSMNITLTIGYNGCYSDTTYTDVFYIEGPVALFYDSVECNAPLEYFFSGNIIDADHWYWDFGDGSQIDSTSISPTHIYPGSGDYLVTLNAYNDETGCSYSDQVLITVRDIQSIFYVDTTYACINELIYFYGAPSIDEVVFSPPGTYYAYLWNFGDSFVDFTDSITNHSYNSPGDYYVSLIVQNVNGCLDTSLRHIKIYRPEPDFIADITGGCMPFNVNFTDQSLSDTTIVDWSWDFGDGNYSSLQNPSHLYDQVGNYDVTLTVTDTIGCANSITLNSFISSSNPIADFTINGITNICAGDIITFNNNSSGTGLQYSWDFGDGAFSVTENPNHQYNDTGYFSINLQITDFNNCVTSYSMDSCIYVEVIPTVNFMGDTIFSYCYPLFVEFSDLSTPSNHITNWHWYFGDNNSESVLQNPIHNYTLPGIYNVALVVSTANGCSDSLYIPAYIIVNGPIATMNMNPDTICFGDEVEFSIDQQVNVTDYWWDFGDGSPIDSINTQITHEYFRYGNIYPSLIYSDQYGYCIKSAIDTLYVWEVIADFEINDSIGCTPLSINFDNNSSNADYCFWNFGDGGQSTGIDCLNEYIGAGTYYPELIILNNFGCRDTISDTIIVYPLPVVNIRDDSLICAGDTILLFAGGGETYNWYPNSYLSNPNISNPFAFPQNSIIYNVAVTDSNTCVNYDSVLVVVQDIPYIYLNDTTIIVGEEIIINHSAEDGVSYNWSPPDGLSCTDCPNPTINTLDPITYTVVMIDSLGCYIVEQDIDIEIRNEFTVDVPTAFTPNGDFVNDIVYVRGWGIKELIEFSIYNRWGQLMFKSNDMNYGWDGKFKGKPQNMDTYVFYVKVKFYNDQIVDKKGTFNLFR